MGCWGWRPIKDGYAPGMRQALLYPRIRKTLNTLDLGSGVRGGAPSMRPLLPFLIATFLCWSPDLTGTRPDLEQGYATRVCAGDETPLGLPRRPSTETRYAPGMRRPHSFAAYLDPAGSRPGSGQNPSGARLCVRDMRWGRDACRLAKTPLDKKQICAGYAPATLLAGHRDPVGARPGSRCTSSGFQPERRLLP